MLLRTALVSWTYPLESGIFHDKLKIARVIPLFKAGEAANIKQIFHAFMFNIRNYSSEVINIQRREVTWILYYRGWIISILNKKKKHGILFY